MNWFDPCPPSVESKVKCGEIEPIIVSNYPWSTISRAEGHRQFKKKKFRGGWVACDGFSKAWFATKIEALHLALWWAGKTCEHCPQTSSPKNDCPLRQIYDDGS